MARSRETRRGLAAATRWDRAGCLAEACLAAGCQGWQEEPLVVLRAVRLAAACLEWAALAWVAPVALLVGHRAELLLRRVEHPVAAVHRLAVGLDLLRLRHQQRPKGRS